MTSDRRLTCALLSMAACLLGGLSGCGGSSAPKETAAERNEAISQAFVNPAGEAEGQGDIVVDAATRAEVDGFFTSLGEAFRGGEVADIATHFSGAGMIKAAESRGLISLPASGEQRAQFMNGFDKGLRGAMAQWGKVMKWHSQDIRKITPLGPTTLLVYARFWDNDLGVYTKQRWWLTRDSGNWQTFDWEDFDQNMRISTLMGAMFGAMTSNKPWVASLRDMMQSYGRAMQSGDIVNALLQLQPQIDSLLANDDLPSEIESLARTMRASGLVLSEKYIEALAELDKIEKLDGGNPMVHYQRGVAFNGLGQYDSALASFEKYAAELGWDADVYELVSDVYRVKGDRPEALSSALKGLEDNANALGCLGSLLLALTPADKGEVAPHIAKLKDPAASYPMLIEMALDAEDKPAAMKVLELFQQAAPTDPLVAHYRDVVAEMADSP